MVVNHLKKPTTHTEPRSFLRLCSRICRFTPEFSRVTALLKYKLQKDQTTSFPSVSDSNKDTEENRKKLLPKSAYSRAAKHDEQIHSQHELERLKCSCRATAATERRHLPAKSILVTPAHQLGAENGNYPQEVPAIVWTVLLLWLNQESSHFITPTRHTTDNGLLTTVDASGKLETLRLRLLGIDLEVVNRADIKN